MEALNKPLNAVEPWIIYDTCQIRADKNLPPQAGFQTLADLANAETVSFFNTRRVGDAGVGKAYCNQDSADSLPFGFVLRSIGVEFMAPRGCPIKTPVSPETGAPINCNASALAVFEQEIVRHVAMELKVSQDQKLLAAVMFTPGGVGITGTGLAGITGAQGALIGNSAAGLLAGSGASQVGDPALFNRWVFKDGLSIPKSCPVSVTLTFSEYAKSLLKAIGAYVYPQYVYGDNEQAYTTIQGTYSIRCSLIGTRLVQQRNELHAIV